MISEKRKELAGKGKGEAVSDPQSSKRKWYEDKKKRQVRAAREQGLVHVPGRGLRLGLGRDHVYCPGHQALHP